MEKYTDICEEHNILVHGIIDSDYYGNTTEICSIPVIDCEESLTDPSRLQYYRENFNFFCASHWLPMTDPAAIYRKSKRTRLINFITKNDLQCISFVDTFSTKLPKSSIIGRGVYIDGYVNLEPKVKIGNFTNIYSHSHIGHDSIIGNNCVFQRASCLASSCIVEDEVYIGIAAKCFKSDATFSKGTFIHEGIYLRRGTVPNEVVSMNGSNMRRVVSYIIE